MLKVKNHIVVSFYHQIKVRELKIKMPVEMQKKSASLDARPMFTNPSSTPVTIATRMMKSLWRSVADLQ